MNEVQEYLISQETKAMKQLCEIAIKKGLPTMFDLAKGMASWLNREHKGNQTLEQLTKHGDKLSEIPLNSENIKSFEKFARKFGVSFALVKDESKKPPCHTVYFKAKDTASMTAAFTAYCKAEIAKAKSPKKTFKEILEEAKAKVTFVDKDKNKKREKEGR